MMYRQSAEYVARDALAPKGKPHHMPHTPLIGDTHGRMFRQGCHHQVPGTTTGTTNAAAGDCGVEPSATFVAAPPRGTSSRLGETAPRRGNQKKRYPVGPTSGGVIRPRYWFTMVISTEDQGKPTPLLREPSQALQQFWRNLRGTRGRVGSAWKMSRSNYQCGGVICDPATE